MQEAVMAVVEHPVFWTCVQGVVIVLVTYLIQHEVAKLMWRVLRRSSDVVPASSIFVNIARACIWTIGAAVFLKACFNYDAAGFVAALGVGGIAISLGCQDTLSNLIGGLQVSLGQLAKPGDYVEVLGQAGRVKDVSWRQTSIVDENGVEHLVPNALMNKNALTRLGDTYSLSVPLALPTTCDLDAFSKKAAEAVEHALGSAAVAGSASVVFDSEKATGPEGKVTVKAVRGKGSRAELADEVVRAIDPLVKRAFEEDEARKKASAQA